MSQSVGKLAVEIVGRDAGLRKMLDGTKASAKSFGAEIGSSSRIAAIGMAGVASAASIAAVGVHMVAMESAAVGRELQASSGAARLHVEAMQSVQYATESVGISGEKAADIFKDFQDKLGDFRSGGGGEFKDFFEQVGDKVGLTAEALAKLSGPDALIAVKKAMDDANVSADRQIFYLESIANDASRLLPLLESSGEGFRKMTDRFNGLNSAMSDSEIERFKDYEQDIKDVQIQWDALTREAALPFLSVLKETLHVMNDIFGDKDGNLINSLSNGYVKNTEEKLGQMIESTKLKIKKLEIEASKNDFWSGKDDAAREDLKRKKLELQALERALTSKQGGNLFVPTGSPSAVVGGSNSDVDSKSTNRLLTEQNRGATLLAQLDQQYANEQEKLQLNLFKQLEQIESMKLTEAEIHKRGYDTLDQLKLDYEAKSHTNYQLELEQIDLREQDKQLREQERMLQEFESIREQFLTRDQVEQEAYTRRQEILNNALNTKLIEEQKHQALSAKNWAKYQDEIAKNERATQLVQMQGYGSLFGSLADITKSFAGEQSGAYKAMFAVSKAFSIAQSIVAIQQGIAQAAANPWPLNLAAMASVASSTASIISTIQGTNLTGMAHDGIDGVPETGTWLLQKGERVINAKQNEKITDAIAGGKGGGGGITVNIIPNPERAGETEETGSGNQRELTIYVNATLNELNQRIARGGNAESRTLEGTYGLSRAAGARR